MSKRKDDPKWRQRCIQCGMVTAIRTHLEHDNECDFEAWKCPMCKSTYLLEVIHENIAVMCSQRKQEMVNVD